MARAMAFFALSIASSRVLPCPDMLVPETVAATSKGGAQCPAQQSIRSRDIASRMPLFVVAFERRAGSGMAPRPLEARFGNTGSALPTATKAVWRDLCPVKAIMPCVRYDIATVSPM